MDNGYNAGRCNLNIEKMYIDEIKKIDILTKDEEIKLFNDMNNGCQYSKNKLINSNLRLVLSVANNYKWFGVSLLDLIQEGNLGLIEAIETFDLDRGCRLSTHASIHIKKWIYLCLPKYYKSVEIPAYMYQRASKIRKSEGKLLNIKNGTPTILDISIDTGLSVKDIENSLLASKPFISLDSETSDDYSDSMLHDVIKCEITNNEITNNYIDNSLKNEIDKLLSILDEDEANVIKLRHGVDGNVKTLKDIGILMELSSERIRTIQNKAMMKLRRYDGIENLEEYLYA